LGSTYCNCVDDEERVNAGTVVANAERTINDANSKAVNAVEISNLVFFIFPLDRCFREVKPDLNNNRVEKEKKEPG
jgi:hypothetical protein